MAEGNYERLSSVAVADDAPAVAADSRASEMPLLQRQGDDAGAALLAADGQEVGPALEPQGDGLRGVCHRLMWSPWGRVGLVFSLWVVVGYFGLKHVNQRKYTNVEMLYVMAQIVTTVGYGDMPKPKHAFDFVFMTCFVVAACLVISQFVTAVGSLIVQKQHEAMNKAVFTLKFDFGDATMPPEWREPWCGFKPSEQLQDVLQACSIWCAFVITWALFFCYYPGEDKRWDEALYMAVITLTTIGFGDKTPVTQGGKLFAAAWMVLGSCSFTATLGRCTAWTLAAFRNFSVEKLDAAALQRMTSGEHWESVLNARKASTQKTLEAFAAGSEEDRKRLEDNYVNRISRNDFLIFILLDMGLVDHAIIDSLDKHFDVLDATQEGYIDEEDLFTNLKTVAHRNQSKASPASTIADP